MAPLRLCYHRRVLLIASDGQIGKFAKLCFSYHKLAGCSSEQVRADHDLSRSSVLPATITDSNVKMNPQANVYWNTSTSSLLPDRKMVLSIE